MEGVTRRRVLQTVGAAGLVGVSSGAYALGIEPLLRLNIARYAVRPTTAPWPRGLTLRIAALADIHACEPWMDVDRIASIVETTNALRPDLVVLLGDYVSAMRVVTGEVPARDWARALAGLRAPLGTHAVLGNHDWWHEPELQRAGGGRPAARIALEESGIPVYENRAVRLKKDGLAFWLAGLGDQVAFLMTRRRGVDVLGIDDLPGTLAQIPEAEPAILLAHEPDVFRRVPARIALTLSGHTHGGQVRLFGYSPIVPSEFGNRYAYGHVREQADLVVSGGLGCSFAPLRFGVPPEIVLVELGADARSA